ncbi:MAG TPA: heavy metal-binding domain-containing protein, partial [Chthoniobacteraceae bacterium]|nr:heavy metal-binding domain-containing protein [Chthoniobacteraceae bacterium]
KRRTALLAAALCAAFTSSVTPLYADAKHTPAAAHGDTKTTDLRFNSVGEAWAVVQGATAQVSELLEAKDLKAIHPVEEQLSAGLKYLEANSPMVTGDKQKRLAAALKQALTLSGNLHTASDATEAGKTAAELKKLEAALQLVAVQYPADTLKAPAGFVKFECPMKDFTGDKAGPCPKCGMKLKPIIAALATGGAHGEHGEAHAHGTKVTTMNVALQSAQPLVVGQKVDVIARVTTKDGKPVGMHALKEAHTRKLHFLIIDESLTDYHHEHPEPTATPGEYKFSFMVRKPGPYRVWADLVPVATGEQEYVIADLPAATKGEPLANRAEVLTAKVEGLTYTVTFEEPLAVGGAALGTLTVKDANGEIFPSLEPVMGAYAHLVGFSEDFQTIAHIHPMGEEPTKETDRGAGKLDFHIAPEQPGLVRLFAQVQIGGVSKFAPFTLHVRPEEKPAASAKK